MKKDTHPEYHEITLVMTDGSERKTRSTWGKPGDVLKLDIDPKTHPAWTGQHRIVDSGGQVARFNKRFGGLGVSGGLASKVARSCSSPSVGPLMASWTSRADSLKLSPHSSIGPGWSARTSRSAAASSQSTNTPSGCS